MKTMIPKIPRIQLEMRFPTKSRAEHVAAKTLQCKNHKTTRGFWQRRSTLFPHPAEKFNKQNIPQKISSCELCLLWILSAAAAPWGSVLNRKITKDLTNNFYFYTCASLGHFRAPCLKGKNEEWAANLIWISGIQTDPQVQLLSSWA